MATTNLIEKFSGLRSLSVAELNEIWAHYDSDGSGYIELGPELDQFIGDLLRASGMETSADDVKEFIEGVLEMFDSDADGKLDFAEMEELLNG